MEQYDVIIIGAGAGGLSAAVEVKRAKKMVLVIDRDKYVGGILKQCVHDGFGLIKFRENLTGPEYIEKLIEMTDRLGVEILTESTVISIEKTSLFLVKFVNSTGIHTVKGQTVILSTGCRERTAKQAFLQGTRPSGVFTAGECQYYINVLGKMPTRKCVILGSGDVGLIMAMRLSIEGAVVEGVYEAKSIPSGKESNINKCLKGYDVPLYLNHTVTRVFGEGRLNAVEVAKIVDGVIDEDSKRIVECDALVLSVGLIPEIELIDSPSVHFDPHTQSAYVDQTMMTNYHGFFVCGNALHNNDLVDYVSETGEIAGRNAANYVYRNRNTINILGGENVSYVIPQRIDLTKDHNRVVCFFRIKDSLNSARLTVSADKKPIVCKKYTNLNASSLQRVIIDFSNIEGKDVVFDVTRD